MEKPFWLDAEKVRFTRFKEGFSSMESVIAVLRPFGKKSTEEYDAVVKRTDCEKILELFRKENALEIEELGVQQAFRNFRSSYSFSESWYQKIEKKATGIENAPAIARRCKRRLAEFLAIILKAPIMSLECTDEQAIQRAKKQEDEKRKSKGLPPLWEKEEASEHRQSDRGKRLDDKTVLGVLGKTAPTPTNSLVKVAEERKPLQKAKRKALKQTREKPIPTDAQFPNPFKELCFYDVEDAKFYFGRKRLTEDAIQMLERGFSDKVSSLAPFMWIGGPSGVGKSSFLRAGVIARLAACKRTPKFCAAAIRISKLRVAADVPQSLFSQLFTQIEEKTGLTFDPAQRNAIWNSDLGDHDLADKAAKLVADAVAKKGKNTYLVVGLDQFEEIEEILTTEGSVTTVWEPLIEFITAARKSGRIGFVVSTSKTSGFWRERSDLEFCDQAKYLFLPPPDETFIEDILQDAFAASPFPLHESLRDELKVGILKFQESKDSGSLLPIIALKLYHLFEHLLEVFPERTAHWHQERLAKGEVITEASKEDISADLTIKDEIKELVEMTWGRIAVLASDTEEEAVGHFLAPMISVQTKDSDDFDLREFVEPGHSSDNNRVTAFKLSKLIIPSSPGFLRLTHKSVVRHWPAAMAWVEKEKATLKLIARYRLLSEEWKLRGSPPFGKNVPPEEIQSAALILNVHLKYWTFLPHGSLAIDDKSLLDYCLEIFSQSTTPELKVPTFGKSTCHVHLAASYSLVSLLEIFSKENVACLSKLDSEGETPIAYAARNAPKAVSFLLEKKVDATLKSVIGWRPLAAAIIGKNWEAFTLLLAYYDKNTLDIPYGGNSVHLCAMVGQLEMMHELIEKKGLSATAKDNRMCLPLHFAAYYGHLKLVKYLMEKAPIAWLATIARGDTPLHLAAQMGHTSVVAFLLDRAKKETDYQFLRNQREQTPLMLAAKNLHKPVVDLLLERRRALDCRPDTSEIPETPIHAAIRGADSDLQSNRNIENLRLGVITLLLNYEGLDITTTDTVGYTAIELAHKRKQASIVAMLLPKFGDDIQKPLAKTGKSLLRIAVENRAWIWILDRVSNDLNCLDAIIDNNNNTPLHFLARQGMPEILLKNLLRKARVKLNAANSRGWTPLMEAVRAEQWKTVRVLLDFGANPAAPRRTKESAFALCIESLDPKAEQFLEELYAGKQRNILSSCMSQWPPFHIATIRRDEQLTSWMLNRVRNRKLLLEARDNLGLTPIDLGLGSNGRMSPNVGFLNPKTDRIYSWDMNLRWETVTSPQSTDVLKEVANNKTGVCYSSSTRIHTTDLPFYPKDRVKVFRLTDPEWSKNAKAYFLRSDTGELHRLDGESHPIHELNAKAPIKLSADNVLDYLRFSCFLIRDTDYPLLILESSVHAEMPGNLLATEIKSIRKQARPAKLINLTEAGDSFSVMATVYLKDCIGFAYFEIQNSGVIDMLGGYILIKNLSQSVTHPIKWG